MVKWLSPMAVNDSRKHFGGRAETGETEETLLTSVQWKQTRDRAIEYLRHLPETHTVNGCSQPAVVRITKQCQACCHVTRPLSVSRFLDPVVWMV